MLVSCKANAVLREAMEEKGGNITPLKAPFDCFTAIPQTTPAKQSLHHGLPAQPQHNSKRYNALPTST
jgi:hypothetical protein